MLVERKANEESESEVKVVYRADGSVAEIRGLAEAIRAAWMKDQAGEFPASLPAIEGGQDYSRGGQADCLAERIRRAKGGWRGRKARYALGSPQSRAAARSPLAARRAVQGEGILIRLVAVESAAPPDRKCTCLVPAVGTFALCRRFYKAG